MTLEQIWGKYGNADNLFEEYKRVTGGESEIYCNVCDGFPKGINDIDDILFTYAECIEKKITWEELLGYKHPPEGAIV